jgi:opacity protein-like surface antigen
MLSVVAKFASNAQKSYHPYLLLSLGVSANKAYHYQTTVPPFITFTPIYASQKNTSLSYSIGGGVDADINKKWRFGVGYRYADLGKANLGAATIDTTAFPPPLKQSHLKAHQFVAQLTYFFAKDA